MVYGVLQKLQLFRVGIRWNRMRLGRRRGAILRLVSLGLGRRRKRFLQRGFYRVCLGFLPAVVDSVCDMCVRAWCERWRKGEKKIE